MSWFYRLCGVAGSLALSEVTWRSRNHDGSGHLTKTFQEGVFFASVGCNTLITLRDLKETVTDQSIQAVTAS